MIQAIKKYFNREPNRYIGGMKNPYLLRWYLVPRNKRFNIYLHKFMRDDDDRALHDHPWASFSVLLWGRYVEVTRKGRKAYRPGCAIYRSATYAHRIELPGGKPCWTLFITGPMVREWGFHCPQGWVHFRKFTNPLNSDETGPGCGEGPAEAPNDWIPDHSGTRYNAGIQCDMLSGPCACGAWHEVAKDKTKEDERPL